MERIRVYVSGPISQGPQIENVEKAMDLTHELMDLGFHVQCPHLTVFLNMRKPRPWRDWIDQDLSIIRHWAEAIFRLPGESRGADCEEDWAREHNIPVFTTVAALVEWRGELIRAQEDSDER